MYFSIPYKTCCVSVYTFKPGNTIIKYNYAHVVNVITSIFTEKNQHIHN